MVSNEDGRERHTVVMIVFQMATDYTTVTLMVRKKYLKPPALYWEFFRNRFLLPSPEENSTTQELLKHMKQGGHGGKERLPTSEAKKLFLEFIHKKWRPKVDYPKPCRAKPRHKDSRESRMAQNFEGKLFDYYDSLLGPDRVVRAGRSTMSGLEEQLGLFCVRELKLYASGKDLKFLWGDTHKFSGTDEQWYKYSKTHSSCFDITEHNTRLRYILSGLLSLCNHDCNTAFLTIIGGGFATASGTNVYKKGEEIFVNYGEDYFIDRPCVCCK